MITDVEQAIRDYLPDIIHMSLATSHEDKPWVCEVHFGYDDELNLYFRSLLSRRHSQEIAYNPSVAGTIVVQHDITMKPRGIYFEGQAQLLTGESERVAALKTLRRAGADEGALEEARREDGHQFYKISVDTYYVFDSRNSKPSAKYELVWKGGK